MNVFTKDMAESLYSDMTGEGSYRGDFGGMSLLEMAEKCLTVKGLSAQGSGQAILNQSLSQGDFDAVLSDAMNRLVQQKYARRPSTFERYTDQGTTPDFREDVEYRIAPGGIFESTDDGAEIKHFDNLLEGSESVKLRTFAGQVGISRQALIGNNKRHVADVAAFLAGSAKRTQNYLAAKKLLSNPTLSDGTTVFHADRSNLLTGGGSALSATSLGNALKALRNISDDAGLPLGIEPKILLVPSSLEQTGAALVKNIAAEGRDRLELVVEPLLELSALSGSATAWYLFPDPQTDPVFRALGIEGRGLSPEISRLVKMSSDEAFFRATIDFDVVPVGSRAVKSDGA